MQSGSSSRPVAPERPPRRLRNSGTRSSTGDSLSKIAKRFYGDGNRWQKIFDANRDQIKDPDLIKPGQKLKIPAVPEVALTRRKETFMRTFSAVVCVVIAFAALACERRSETPAPGAQPPAVSAPTPPPARVTAIELGSAIGADGRVAAGAGEDDVLPDRHDLRVDR